MAGYEVWRAADTYDSLNTREYYQARGMSLAVEGIARVAMLWSAGYIVRNVPEGVASSSNSAAESVMWVVMLVVGTEILAKTCLQWGIIANDTTLSKDQLTMATETTMAQQRLFVYPLYMGTVAYFMIRFRSWWATGALALANGNRTGARASVATRCRPG